MSVESGDLEWPNCSNARDLGGGTTIDGRCVRTGPLIRTDNLNHLNADGIRCVYDAGVSRVIDLRRRSEARAHPTPFLGDPCYLNIQIEDDAVEFDEPQSPSDAATTKPERSVVESYLETLFRHPREVASVLAAIVEAPDGAVVFHCDAGKDRTGCIAALTLSVLGVAREKIAADYAYSFLRLQKNLAGQRARVRDQAQREQTRKREEPRPQNILEVLGSLEKRFGSIEGYLCHGGLGKVRQAALCERLLSDQ